MLDGIPQLHGGVMDEDKGFRRLRLIERTGEGVKFQGIIERKYYNEMIEISIQEDISIRKLVRRMCIKYLEGRHREAELQATERARTIQGKFKKTCRVRKEELSSEEK